MLQYDVQSMLLLPYTHHKAVFPVIPKMTPHSQGVHERTASRGNHLILGKEGINEPQQIWIWMPPRGNITSFLDKSSRVEGRKHTVEHGHLPT
jgi:hypothetical protein